MSLPPSTPFPLRTFQSSNDNDASSPAAFRQSLLRIIEQDLSDEHQHIKIDDASAWVTVVSGFSDHLFSTFPSSRQGSWDVLHEKAALIDAALEIVHRLLKKTSTLFDGREDLARNISTKLMCLCGVLESRDDVGVVVHNGIPSPDELKRKTRVVLLQVLTYLDNSVTGSGGGKATNPVWEVLKNIMDESLELVQELVTLAPTFLYPARARLFHTPHLVSEVDDQTDQTEDDKDPLLISSILLEDSTHAAEFICLLLEMQCSLFEPPPHTHAFLEGTMPLISQLASAAATSFLSCPWNFNGSRRARCLSRILNAVKHLCVAHPHGAVRDMYSELVHQAILYRLKSDAQAFKDALDPLLDMDGSLFYPVTPKIHVHTLVQAMLQLQLEDNDDKAVILLTRVITPLLPVLDFDTLTLLRTTFTSEAIAPFAIDFLASVNRRLKPFDGDADNAMEVDVYEENPTLPDRAQSLLQIIHSSSEPSTYSMTGPFRGDDSPEELFSYLGERFECDLQNLSTEKKIAILKALAELPCLVCSCIDGKCARPLNVGTAVPTYTKIAAKFLLSEDSQTTDVERKYICDAVACAVRHHRLDGSQDGFSAVEELAINLLSDKNRSVRISAGRIVTESIRVYDKMGKPAWTRVERYFDAFYHLLDVAKDSVKETTLITVGAVGRATTKDILGVAISCLISQLAKPNLVTKGLAYLQLAKLPQHFRKSPYRLLSPYMDKIAPFLISRYVTQPSLLDECCRFLCMPPLEFISVNLPSTLPHLFATSEIRVLERISEKLDITISSLLINHEERILAHVLMLQGEGQTDEAVAFIENVLTSAAPSGKIEIQSFVRSCMVHLLATLVVPLGDEDPNVVEAATQALRKVNALAAAGPQSRRKRSQTGDLGEFLRTHILGIISQNTDILQDIHGKNVTGRKKPAGDKRRILRGLGTLAKILGPSISSVSHQIMATFQMMLGVPDLADVALDSWYIFLTTLTLEEVGLHAGPTSACMVYWWPSLSEYGKEVVIKSLHFLVFDLGAKLDAQLDDVVDMSSIPALADIQTRLMRSRHKWTNEEKLQKLVSRASGESVAVIVLALRELKAFMDETRAYFEVLASGDLFNGIVGRMMNIFFKAACRDGDGAEDVRLAAFECIGALGAVDADRFDFGTGELRPVILKNFTDEEENVTFALHLVTDVLVGTFRSTNDVGYQLYVGFTIQELLKFCGFTPALVSHNSTASLPLRVRGRWSRLPKHVLETATPLLEGRLTATYKPLPEPTLPVYPSQDAYREWVQIWTSHLITRVSGGSPKAIFPNFLSIVRNRDVTVANYLLPHLVLHVLISGDDEDVDHIHQELMAVLKDSVDSTSRSTRNKKLLATQCVFILMDHLSKWVRLTRLEVGMRKAESRRGRGAMSPGQLEVQLPRVESVISSIQHDWMANAAFQCNAYARALMSLEQHITSLQERKASFSELQHCYERLHEIYACIDEPDGMEGVSMRIVSPTLEYQIRQHESAGHWTSAQSCWELRLQQAPDNLDYHIGLLRCLRNLGHYDSLRTHVKGVLKRNPDWASALGSFQVEGAWVLGNWDEVQDITNTSDAQTSSMVMARLLLTLRNGNSSALRDALSGARTVLGAPIIAAGAREYRRSYETVLSLHQVHEVEMIHDFVANLPLSGANSARQRQSIIADLKKSLLARLDSTLPSLRAREPILSLRRTVFSLSSSRYPPLMEEIGRTWLVSAKIARRTKHWQSAYSAILQAQQRNTPFAFLQGVRLTRDIGEKARALQDLNHSLLANGIMGNMGAIHDVIDLTDDDDETKQLKSKAEMLYCRWMDDSERYDLSYVLKAFSHAYDTWPKWESGAFHFGRFQDKYNKNLPSDDKTQRGIKSNLSTVKCFISALKLGNKYIYQSLPRLLTIWLDAGEKKGVEETEAFARINSEVAHATQNIPAYKWYTAFTQITSRVEHSNSQVYSVLGRLITKIIVEHPHQSLWQFAAVVKSTKDVRAARGRHILDKLKSTRKPVAPTIPPLVNECLAMVDALLKLCHFDVKGDTKTLNMRRDFPGLARLTPSNLIIPLQDSMIPIFPPTSSTADSQHHPFPIDAPKFHRFLDEIDVMRSLAKPRKITIIGDNNLQYMFLGKPKDDLRKDARLMDFNGVINKLLKAGSESRRRQLHIRTYAVITLNEECGFIQWVPDTIPIRPILLKYYEARGVRNWNAEMNTVFDTIKASKDRFECGRLFVERILPIYTPVFHEWFIETFPEPSAWLASRLTYSRTAAVMSIVGFILGLGDRHCENILMDENTGAVVHVDFNCLFEKGKTLEVPERVPFRLTQNMVDGLGVTGPEGVFRIACETTFEILTANKDTLMSFLDPFIHDPLVEWEDEKRKLERDARKVNGHGPNKPTVDMRLLAKNALEPIAMKLKGVYRSGIDPVEKEFTPTNLVQTLIEEAMDSFNLGKMYPGWAPWH
ncbi:hypothetical protein OF83DRAFT_1093546 [Amylostereum chailletii]|nr:hypothetical protein OF83DRAFT_1093546 [Amylostereum chailletii]